MRNLTLAMAFLAAGATTATAAETPAVDPATIQSVWEGAGDGGLTHLQSGLACPATLGEFRRVSTGVYDGAGFDAGCNYAASGAALTIYMTRKGAMDVAATMAAARAEYVAAGAAQHPVFQSEDQVTDGGRAWTVARYAEDAGRRSEIWLAELDGWLVQYRTTFMPSGQARTEAGVRAMTANVLASAGPPLAACAKAGPVTRDGKRVTDTEQIGSDAMMSAIIGGALMSAAKEEPRKGKTRKAKDDAEDVLEQPIVWCPQQAYKQDGYTAVFWRGVRTDGSDAQIDRATLVTKGPPAVLSVGLDGMLGLIKDDGKPPRWAASIADEDQVVIYGYFEGRPKVEAVLGLLSDIVAGKAQAVGGYSVGQGSSITIMMPPSK